MPGISMILRRKAAMGCPTFPVILSLFRVLLESFATILARSLAHRTHVACQETFRKIHLHQMNRQHLLKDVCAQEIPPLRMTNLCFSAQGDPERELMKQIRTLKALQFQHRDMPEMFRL